MNVTIEIPPWATHVVSDHTDMERAPRPVDRSSVARFTIELPDDVYYEYGFLDASGELRPDPNNDRRAENPWHPTASAIVGPEYAPDPYAELPADRATGELRRYRWESPILGEARRMSVYTPDGAAGSLPMVLVQDGTAYLRIARLPSVLQALVDEGAAGPARLVLIEPVDRQAEYGFDDAYRRFVLEEVLPRVEDEHGEPTDVYALGASLGGLFSLTLALRHPGLIAGVATQSGAFLGSPETREFYDADESWVLETLATAPPPPWAAYTEVGTMEWLTGVNRDVHEQLAALGDRHAYAERNAGHNWVNWRNGLSSALRFLLGPDRLAGPRA